MRNDKIGHNNPPLTLEDFIIKEFIDKFLSFGVIPMPLIRWEMLGDDTEIRAITRSSSEIKIQ